MATTEESPETLSIHSRKLPESDAFRKDNDSPDPTYRGCWPSERYPSDGPERAVSTTASGTCCADQCDISCSPDVSCDRKDDATRCDEAANVTDAHSYAAPSHRIGTCYLDPDTGETVMPGDFFGEKELRWMPDCGTVKDKPPDCQAYGEREPVRFAHEAPANLPVGARSEQADTFSVPFGVQSWLFEALIELEIDHLHEIIDDHLDEIVVMARKRHREGHVVYGSKGYQWDAKTRLRNVLEELADGGTYLTMGAIE